MNLETHLAEHDEDLKQVILRISEVAKTISRGFATRQGVSDTSNVYGEQQAAMDVWADELLISELKDSKLVRFIASEEQPDVLTFKESSSDLGITIDPVDGSSLLGVNLAVGTIIGIYRGNVLIPGEEMLGAMYVLYGPLTTLTYSLRKGVHEFAMDDRGDFILQKEGLEIPEGKIYALSRENRLVFWHGIPVPILGDYITILSPDGNITKKIYLYDLVKERCQAGGISLRFLRICMARAFLDNL